MKTNSLAGDIVFSTYCTIMGDYYALGNV